MDLQATFNSVIIALLWIGICDFVNCKELAHVSIFTRTTEVRFYHHRKYKWPKGKLEQFCAGFGMEVLVPYNLETYMAVYKYLMKQNKYTKAGYWFSLNDRKKNMNYYYADGSEYRGYFSWRYGEPSESEAEACTALKLDSGSFLLDISCEKPEFYVPCSRRLGKPKIDYIEEKACQSSVELRWTPHANSVGVKHRITAHSTSNDHTIIVDDYVRNTGTRTTLVGKLRAGLQYKIELTVCTDHCCCGVLSDSTKTAPSFGLEAKIDMVTFLSTSDGKCRVTWKSRVQRHKVTDYRVTLASSPAHLRDVSEKSLNKQEVVVIEGKQEYEFNPELNREYVVWVQAGTCAGYGPKKKSSQSCIKKEKTTVVVPNPSVLFFLESQVLLVGLPRKSASPISCVFVLAHPFLPDEQLDTSMDKTIGKDVIKAASGKPPGTDAPYLAAALPRSYINEDYTDVELGTGRKTQCNMAVLEEKKGNEASFAKGGGKENTVQGQNWELKTEWSYSFFVAISRPVDGTIVIERSASGELSAVDLKEQKAITTAEPAEPSSAEASECSTGLIVAAFVVIILDVILGVVVGFLIVTVVKAKSSTEEAAEDWEEEEENAYGVQEEEETLEDRRKEKNKKKKHKDKDKDSSSGRTRKGEERMSRKHHRKYKK